MSKQQLARILEISAQNPPPANVTPPAMRAWAEGVTSHTPFADHVAVSRSSFGPYPGDLILPDGGDPSRLIIYYHGGGFFLFSAHTYRVTTTNLARVAGVAVFAPDYRLAPENPAPAAHDDAFNVYELALKQGYAAHKIALVAIRPAETSRWRRPCARETADCRRLAHWPCSRPGSISPKTARATAA